MSTPVIVRNIPVIRELTLANPFYNTGERIERVTVVKSQDNVLTVLPEQKGSATPDTRNVSVFSDFTQYLSKKDTILLVSEDGKIRQYILPSNAGTVKPGASSGANKQWATKKRAK